MGFKNASAATLAATGLTVILDVPFAWTSSLLVTTFVTVYHLPNIVNGLINLKDRAENFVENNKPRAKALAKDAAKKAKEFIWAVSPTNPEQNATIGTTLGFAASSVAANLLELSAKTSPLVVGASTIGGGIAGHYLPKSTVDNVISKANLLFSPSAVGKVAKVGASAKISLAKVTSEKESASAANDSAKSVAKAPKPAGKVATAKPK
jgi:hypothetical protein